MTISSTSQLSSLLAQMLNSPHQAGSPIPTAASTTSSASGSLPPAGLKAAILDALRRIGVNGSTSPSPAKSASGAGSPSAQSTTALALQSFMASLLAALRPPSGPGLPLAGRPSHAVHSPGDVQERLSSLIRQLQAPTGWAGGPSAPSAPGTLAALQRSFDHLLHSTGDAAPNSASLGTFLNTLASDLRTSPPAGHLVSTQA